MDYQTSSALKQLPVRHFIIPKYLPQFSLCRIAPMENPDIFWSAPDEVNETPVRDLQLL